MDEGAPLPVLVGGRFERPANVFDRSIEVVLIEGHRTAIVRYCETVDRRHRMLEQIETYGEIVYNHRGEGNRTHS